MSRTRGFLGGIAVDDASVYAAIESLQGSSVIIRASRCGHGNVAPLVIANDASILGLVMDDKFLYWGSRTGVMRLEK
jgi:hypothetical protein